MDGETTGFYGLIGLPSITPVATTAVTENTINDEQHSHIQYDTIDALKTANNTVITRVKHEANEEFSTDQKHSIQLIGQPQPTYSENTTIPLYQQMKSEPDIYAVNNQASIANSNGDFENTSSSVSNYSQSEQHTNQYYDNNLHYQLNYDPNTAGNVYYTGQTQSQNVNYEQSTQHFNQFNTNPNLTYASNHQQQHQAISTDIPILNNSNHISIHNQNNENAQTANRSKVRVITEGEDEYPCRIPGCNAVMKTFAEMKEHDCTRKRKRKTKKAITEDNLDENAQESLLTEGTIQHTQPPGQTADHNETKIIHRKRKNDEAAEDYVMLDAPPRKSMRPANLTVSADNQVNCEVCGEKVSKHYIKNHMDYHRGRKFICDVCGAEFTYRRALTRHRHKYQHSVGGRVTTVDEQALALENNNQGVKKRKYNRKKKNNKDDQSPDENDLSQSPRTDQQQSISTKTNFHNVNSMIEGSTADTDNSTQLMNVGQNQQVNFLSNAYGTGVNYGGLTYQNGLSSDTENSTVMPNTVNHVSYIPNGVGNDESKSLQAPVQPLLYNSNQQGLLGNQVQIPHLIVNSQGQLQYVNQNSFPIANVNPVVEDSGMGNNVPVLQNGTDSSQLNHGNVVNGSNGIGVSHTNGEAFSNMTADIVSNNTVKIEPVETSQVNGYNNPVMGMVTHSNGLVTQSSGLETSSASLVRNAAGLVTNSSGLVTNSAGLVTNSSGSVTNSAGLVTNSNSGYTYENSDPSNNVYATQSPSPELNNGTYEPNNSIQYSSFNHINVNNNSSNTSTTDNQENQLNLNNYAGSLQLQETSINTDNFNNQFHTVSNNLNNDEARVSVSVPEPTDENNVVVKLESIDEVTQLESSNFNVKMPGKKCPKCKRSFLSMILLHSHGCLFDNYSPLTEQDFSEIESKNNTNTNPVKQTRVKKDPPTNPPKKRGRKKGSSNKKQDNVINTTDTAIVDTKLISGSFISPEMMAQTQFTINNSQLYQPYISVEIPGILNGEFEHKEIATPVMTHSAVTNPAVYIYPRHANNSLEGQISEQHPNTLQSAMIGNFVNPSTNVGKATIQCPICKKSYTTNHYHSIHKDFHDFKRFGSKFGKKKFITKFRKGKPFYSRKSSFLKCLHNLNKKLNRPISPKYKNIIKKQHTSSIIQIKTEPLSVEETITNYTTAYQNSAYERNKEFISTNSPFPTIEFPVKAESHGLNMMTPFYGSQQVRREKEIKVMHVPVQKRKTNQTSFQLANQVECTVCGNMVSKHYMRTHMAYHKGKIFSCDKCGMEFKYRRALYRHTILHNNSQGFAFSCNQCSLYFQTGNRLTRHNIDHHGIKQSSRKMTTNKTRTPPMSLKQQQESATPLTELNIASYITPNSASVNNVANTLDLKYFLPKNLQSDIDRKMDTADGNNSNSQPAVKGFSSFSEILFNNDIRKTGIAPYAGNINPYLGGNFPLSFLQTLQNGLQQYANLGNAESNSIWSEANNGNVAKVYTDIDTNVVKTEPNVDNFNPYQYTAEQRYAASNSQNGEVNNTQISSQQWTIQRE